MDTYTCNVSGDRRDAANAAGYKAYHASGVTAVEVPAASKADARAKAAKIGTVLYVFL